MNNNTSTFLKDFTKFLQEHGVDYIGIDDGNVLITFDNSNNSVSFYEMEIASKSAKIEGLVLSMDCESYTIDLR